MPVKTDYLTFLKRRLSKIVVPTLVWTAIYLSLRIYYSESEINLLQALFSVPFSAQGHGVLWFMYTLIGLYLLAPILSAWVEKATDKEIMFVLLLWCVTLCYPLLKMWLCINTGTTGILYYFTGYAGYFLLGYALRHNRITMRLGVPLTISIAGICILLTLKGLDIIFDFYSLFWYESIFIAALCCVYWIAEEWISPYFQKKSNFFISKITDISNCCFGIYLSHILIMREWLWKMNFIISISNYVLQTIVIIVLTILFSTIISLCLSKLKIGQWIIGYSSAIK